MCLWGQCRGLHRADDEEREADEEDGEVDELEADVLFVEGEEAVEERDYDAAAPYHGDDGYHRAGERERVEVGQIGHGEEDGDEGDGPLPPERRGRGVYLHDDGQRDAHDDELVERVPRLYLEGFEAGHEILVVEGADGAERGGAYGHPNPAAGAQRESLAASDAADEEERPEAQQHAGPLPCVEPLAEDE